MQINPNPQTPHTFEEASGADQAGQGVAKITRECARGAFVLGSALGTANALYARAVSAHLAGCLPTAFRPAVALLPALGVGATALSDAVSVKALGSPTDPEGATSEALAWVAPVVMGLSFAAYRYAPIKKPPQGSLKDMAAQVAVASAAGGLTCTTREWLAQRAARKPHSATLGQASAVKHPACPPDVWDRASARAATQVLAVGMRMHTLAHPALGPRLFLPTLIASCTPYGWRDDLASQISKARSGA